MPNTRVYTRSFGAGIIGPEMFGRIDDAKYQSGAATMLNFIATPQGPAENRPGFMYVNATKNNGVAKLIPFTYSTDQTMVLELGEQYMRFHTQGETLLQPPPSTDPYEIVTPYHATDVFGIHYVQSADVMTLVHPLYPPMELARLGATNWTLTPIAFQPAISPPGSVTATPSPGLTVQVTSVAINSSNALITTATNHTLSMGDQIYINGLNAIVSGTMTDFSNYFIVSSVPTDSSGNLINHELYVQDYNGAPLNTATWSSWHPPTTIQLANKSQDPYSHYVVTATADNGVDESVPSATVSALNNLDVPGSYNTITWAAVPGAIRYTVYKERNGLFGYIGETTALQFVDDNIAADFSITPPYYDTMFAGPGDYPSAVSYYEQRKVYGGTLNEPENIWMSDSGTESTFSYSLPIKATDRVAIRVAAREANTIRHLVPLTRLIPMTSAAEWAVVPVGADAITPTSISVMPQSYVGSNNVQPSVVNNLMVFCANRGGHVRELGYQWQSNAFVTGDMSLRCTQLFNNMTLVDQTFGKAPRPILWFVSSGGYLLGLTYVPEEQIGAWHQHTTDGNFESVCSIAEGTEDFLYAVINRTINGNTVRYVERMASRLFPNRELAVFLDASLTYNGAPATTISGLDHLEGMAVTVLADGGVVEGLVVSGGSITLPHSASIVTVGLPYICDVQSLPLLLQVDGYGQGRSKNINKAWLRVWLSSGIFIGPDEDNLIEAKQRTTEPYGSPPALQTDEIMIMTTPQWQQSGQVLIRQVYPLPLTVVSLTMEVAIGG